MAVWRRGNKVKLVPETAAQGRIREIYDDLKRAFGLPQVSLMHQAFAGFPEFLDAHWRIFSPLIETRDFFQLADRLRADTYTRVFTYLEIPDLAPAAEHASARRDLLAVAELAQYKNALMLLLVAAQLQAFESPVGVAGRSNPERAHHPVFPDRPVIADEQHSSAPLRKALQQLRRASGDLFLAPDYLAFANWPDFFLAYWDALRTSMQSPMYEGCRHTTRQTALMLARELPGPIETPFDLLSDVGISPDDISSIVRITETFMDGISRLVVNTAFARIALEGGTRKHGPEVRELQPPGKDIAA